MSLHCATLLGCGDARPRPPPSHVAILHEEGSQVEAHVFDTVCSMGTMLRDTFAHWSARGIPSLAA